MRLENTLWNKVKQTSLLQGFLESLICVLQNSWRIYQAVFLNPAIPITSHCSTLLVHAITLVPDIVSLLVLSLQPQVYLSKSCPSFKTHHKCPHSRNPSYFFLHKAVSFHFDLLLVSLKLASVVLLVIFLNATYYIFHLLSIAPLASSKQNQLQAIVVQNFLSFWPHLRYPICYSRPPSDPQRFHSCCFTLPPLHKFGFLHFVTLCPPNPILSFKIEFKHHLPQGGIPDVIQITFLCASIIH